MKNFVLGLYANDVWDDLMELNAICSFKICICLNNFFNQSLFSLFQKSARFFVIYFDVLFKRIPNYTQMNVPPIRKARRQQLWTLQKSIFISLHQMGNIFYCSKASEFPLFTGTCLFSCSTKTYANQGFRKRELFNAFSVDFLNCSHKF